MVRGNRPLNGVLVQAVAAIFYARLTSTGDCHPASQGSMEHLDTLGKKA